MTRSPLYLATAIEGALAAGRTHRRYFRQQIRVDKKGPIDLVTAADLEAEAGFRALIASRFPDHVVLGEEAGAGTVAEGRPAPCRWIIDPVDGTTNFVHGLALFCVSVALEIDGRVDVAAVYEPIGDELFTAERGQGARLNGRPLRVSQCGDLIDALLCTGFPYSIRDERRAQVDVFAAFLERARGVRRLGSAALDLCYLAAGRFDGFWEEKLHPWDMAAGVLVIEEAGGVVTSYGGASFDLFGARIVASNGRIHDAMLEALDAARAPDGGHQ